MQRRSQTDLADHERRTPRPLVAEKAGGRQRGGPDRILGHVDPARPQPGRQVPTSEPRVVGEHEERELALAKEVQKPIGSRDHVLLVNEHAVHIHQPRADRAAFRARQDHLGGRQLRAHTNTDLPSDERHEREAAR